MGMTPFTDPTLLAELTDEQKRELGLRCLGYVWSRLWDHGSWLSEVKVYPTGKVLVGNGHWTIPVNVPTLGRLQALLYALGGET